jgi:hypothetical protein
MGPQLLVRSRPERRLLRLLAREPLLHLLGARTIQFFHLAYLPLLKNQFQVNTFIQITQMDGLPLLHRQTRRRLSPPSYTRLFHSGWPEKSCQLGT